MDASPATADLDEIRAGLAAGIEALSLDLLGEPTAKGRSEWRWGRRGSLSVVVRGPKHGLWHDHERGEGGDALSWTRRFLGTPDPHGAPCQDDPRERTRRPQRREEARGEPEEDADDAARLARAPALGRGRAPRGHPGGGVPDRGPPDPKARLGLPTAPATKTGEPMVPSGPDTRRNAADRRVKPGPLPVEADLLARQADTCGASARRWASGAVGRVSGRHAPGCGHGGAAMTSVSNRVGRPSMLSAFLVPQYLRRLSAPCRTQWRTRSRRSSL
jgi:hypothetical protein